ncbi:MAG: HEAT repeat domain-containing protein, partial [Bryobacteraceae bacterium]
ALGKFKDPRVVEPLISELKDSYSEARYASATALGDVKDPRAIPPLITALRDPEENVRFGVAMGLKDFGKLAVEPLLGALKDPSPEVRAAVALALMYILDARVVDPLIAALKDADPQVRRPAAGALIHRVDVGIQVERLVGVLIGAMKDPDARVRLVVAAGLSEGKDPRAAASLLEAWKNGDTAAIAGGCAFFLRRREPGYEGPILEALAKFGDWYMAGVYAESDNPKIRAAGQKWLSTHTTCGMVR